MDIRSASGRKVSTRGRRLPGLTEGMTLAWSPGALRRLEARFHPSSKTSDAFVVVGRVVCDQHRATIEPADIAPNAVKPFDSARLHEKLEFLVLSVAGDPCRSLLELRSGFWSFVEISTPRNDSGAA